MIGSRLRWLVSAKTSSSAIIQTAIGRVGLVFATFGSGVLTARNLGPGGRGEQAAMTLWPGFVAYALTFGIQAALVYHARKHGNERDSLISAALIWSLVLGAIATVIGIIFMPMWLSKYDDTVIFYARVLMIFSPFALLGVTMNAVFEVQFKFSASNLLRYGMPAIVLLALIVLVFSHKLTPLSSAIAYTVPGTGLLVAMLPLLFRSFSFTMIDFVRSSKRLFGYGSRVYASNLLTTFGLQIDQVLVVNLLTPANLGTYTVALSVSRVLSLFQSSLAIVIIPKTSGLSDARVAALTGCAARLNLAATGLSAIALASAIPILLPKVYGHDFRASVIVSQILIVEAVISSTAGVLIQAFMATNRPGTPTLFQAIGLSLAVPLMFVLIPRYGLVGAALSLLASTCLRLVLAMASYPLLLHEKMPGLILRKADIDFAMASIRRQPSADVSL